MQCLSFAFSVSNNNEAENANLSNAHLCILLIISGSDKQYLSTYEDLVYSN